MSAARTKLTALLLVAAALTLPAQDFGFGDAAEDGGEGNAAGSLGAWNGGSGEKKTVSWEGEVSATLQGYTGDFKEGVEETRLGDVFEGKLNFKAAGSLGEAVIKLKLAPVALPASPVSIDEAYGAAYLGRFTLEGGLKKLSWGRADSLGPLDVINPLDYSDMSRLDNLQDLKIARPLVHAAFELGNFTKVEAVFVPIFEGTRFATEGRWAPARMNNMIESSLKAFGMDPNTLTLKNAPKDLTDAKTFETLKYAQGGVRFTTTFGSTDMGVQYYYGRLHLPTPSVNYDAEALAADLPTIDLSNISVVYDYNPYHQIGADWGQVIAGLNCRAEVAANLTEDLKGNKGDVYNPTIAWSLGFDVTPFWDLAVNLQCNESIRLFHNKINDTPLLDVEAGKKLTSTRFIGNLSRKFLREEWELKVTGIWGVEDRDFLIMPALVWTRDDLAAEVAGGIFGGDRDGELGQYRDQDYVRVALTYKF